MSLRPASCLALLALVVVACADPPAPQPPAPPEVTVAVPEQRDVETYAEFTGRTVAFAQVEVRARVRGFLERVHYQPSEFVREGALLFSIEDADYVAARDQAEAEVLSWESELARLTADVGRLEMALESRAVSVQEVDATRAQRDQAEARLFAARASLQQAELNLGYTEIRAPIAGRVNRWFVDPGNLVGSGDNTLLTTVVRMDPIHTYWNMSESMVLELLERIRKEGRQRRDRAPRQGEYPVFVGLGNEEGWPHEGWIDYMDSSVDANTGTIQMRGLFPNTDGALLPGLFARIRLPATDPIVDAVLIEERAIGTDLTGKYVYVVAADDVVEQRNIELGQLEGKMRVVTSGLAHGELYITVGLQRARPGLPVNPSSPGH